MTVRTDRRSLRRYHFGATLLAIGIALWVLYGVTGIRGTLDKNYERTQCNQGMLALSLHDVWDEALLSKCPPELKKPLEARYK